MEYLENPFTPSFGEVPAHLAGRQQIIQDLDRAFLSHRSHVVARDKGGIPRLDCRKDDRAPGNA